MSPAISFASSRTQAARNDDLVAEPPPPVTRRLHGRRAAATIRVASCYARAGSGQAAAAPQHA